MADTEKDQPLPAPAIEEQDDLAFWASKSGNERIQEVERLRLEFHGPTRYNQGIRRVVRKGTLPHT